MEDCASVDGDPSQIHQVLVNLCINALEAMPEGGILALTSRVRELQDSSSSGLPLPQGPYLELAVSDTGIGMTEDVRQRVFEPFFTTKNLDGMAGTGLGLATAYGIVQTHRGAITAESIREKGSTFRVFLPVGTLTLVAKDPAHATVRGQGIVLIVEDEPLLRELAATVLDSLGYETVTAADGEEALVVYRHYLGRLTAVLLDLKMPRMAGREAFLEMRKIDPGVPVIICTGYGENEEVQELLTLGASGMLAKPYRIADLAAKLESFAIK
jgi:CheY-like chemotaxis protein